LAKPVVAFTTRLEDRVGRLLCSMGLNQEVAQFMGSRRDGR
ncbi:4244_t:CDS:1, partial [Acaulospora colombiana]